MILFNELFRFLPQEEFYAQQCVEHLDRDTGTHANEHRNKVVGRDRHARTNEQRNELSCIDKQRLLIGECAFTYGYKELIFSKFDFPVITHSFVELHYSY
jgi:hypothetical protein